ncbi:uncharacterized protein TNCV_3848841 [Trichonephila clavipes]|uniref:Uncharacterized protein n=1 Tax=Trichonephila clavipes TaxID=2585209 RepID=A0A8X6RDR8_TRICX|nr:uncharacterized protein TNCV_3848841 [Trichonephila clavipes]
MRAFGNVILNHGQMSWPPLLTTTPHQREKVSALDRFSMHRCPTRRVFSGTGLKLVTRQATIQYLDHSTTEATADAQNPHVGVVWKFGVWSVCSSVCLVT